MENNPASILLVDNTCPRVRPSDDEALSQTPTAAEVSRRLSRRLTRPSVRGELARRKYAKWQPHRLGITDDGDPDPERRPSEGRDLALTDTATNTVGGAPSLATTSSLPTNEPLDSNPIDFAPSADPAEQGSDGRDRSGSRSASRTAAASGPESHAVGLKPGTDLDILYENQRGWFLCGIPLYSHRSLLNFDPATWVTHDFRDSPVNITNAQLPDPSWEWAWRRWYVDMSGDVDDQGWQYSFSFSSSAWHGSHPWFHSFVRRRRWVRLRVKRVSERSRRDRTGLEMAHMLNDDYFTIHTGKKKRASSSERASRVTSGYLSRATTKVEEEAPLEEIGNIPSLMHALKVAIVDREKIDALRRFVEEGGPELYYLEGQIPDIMPMFVFQASRWQVLTHFVSVIDELTSKIPEVGEREAEELRRKKEYLTKAVESARHHLRGPEVVSARRRSSAPEMLDLTPGPKKKGLLSKYLGKFSFKPMDDGGPIRGIPKGAEIGKEGHIYQYSS
ncbi:hypothetical protein P170DRAFT_403801 [Aspergillus steynii IBT 23096]|uniref:Peroxin/Ferlin domain-containing protein n=1 Tax=Aspergillus steynii IBT 23096 TaxID=1392250 RepID=A0A2I2GJI5_9EURO|nr:uncharacterized protein P170DRAFT_403801 [Aspergillus steynii IBT 23096]PLB53042.1 hypothetical protein P170DRAFT_403801 [Aspergillus steynii IBT 23096]